MTNRYIHIFSFVAALLMLATFFACEADDKIVFVTGTTTEPEPEFKLPILPNPGEGKTTVVLYVPENTKSCYAVGTINGWNVDNTEYTFTSIQGTDDKRWVACTFDYAEDMRIKVLAVPYDPNMSLGWSFQWGKNMDPANDLEEDNVIILDGEGELGTENGGQVFLYYSTSANNSVIYIQIKSWEMSPTFENGHEWVDLGLSVKWATCNVGASSPEDYGDYFAWGEITPKTTYSSSNYSYSDNPTILPLSDDAARANWGGSWRMPTYAEMTELCEQCTWTWTSQNGVNGYRVMSKSNGNSIFFPAAGFRYDSSLNGAGSYGYYWSSTLGTGYQYHACYVYFNSSYADRINYYDRLYGLSVRPVLGEYVAETNIPVVVTSSISQITETTAVAGGNVTNDGGASVIERGVVYSTNPNPVITNLSNTIRPCGSGTGEFTYNITDLQPNTTYYLRAYAKNDVGIAYGEEVSFTTETQSELKGSKFWPIVIDGTTAYANASKIVADFCRDDVGKFLYVWDGTYVVNDNPTGLNFHGNADGYTSLIVSTMGWAGCAYCLTETDASNAWQAAEALRAAIVASPDDYDLHMALKSTDKASHCFYIFDSEATKFVIGSTAVYDGPLYEDFTRNGEWAEFDIPMSRFATALAVITCEANMNIFVALTEGVAGAQLNMDAIYFYKK